MIYKKNVLSQSESRSKKRLLQRIVVFSFTVQKDGMQQKGESLDTFFNTFSSVNFLKTPKLHQKQVC